MALARNEHHIAGTGTVQCRSYGEFSVGFGHNTFTVVARYPRDDGIDDREWVFRTRIIGGDHHHVGEAGCHCAHLGSLVSISVATATEHHDHPLAGAGVAHGA